MTINAIGIIPCKTASCSIMGDYAIKKKMNRTWSKKKVGDIVLFDFNGNGTSDHTGILEKINKDGTITVIEGNTSKTSNDNGGNVMRQKRSKSQVNYFIRPDYNKKVTAKMVIATAKEQIGTKEKPSGSNKVKYNTWFYGTSVSGAAYPWCATFVCWVFAHVKSASKSTFPGTFPNIPAPKIIECTRSVNGMRKHGLISGDYILRFKALDKRYKMCKFSRAVVGNDKISYSNYPKFEDRVKKFGYDLKKAASIKTSANCSNFVDGAVGAVSGRYVRDLGAKHNKAYLTKTNLFNAYKYEKSDLRAGDICGTPQHTWMIIQGPVLSIGCEGTNVKRLQRFLKWYGFNINVDGDFGVKTHKAVRKFQKEQGLKVSGAFGSKTLAKAKKVKK